MSRITKRKQDEDAPQGPQPRLERSPRAADGDQRYPGVAASSSTDLQAVVNAVVQSAIQVGGADVAAVHVRAGDMLRSAACTLPEMGGGVQPLALVTGWNGRAILEARTIHVPSPWMSIWPCA